MKAMITASLILNILVLIPVCISLIKDSKGMQQAAGIFTPARGILLAIYLTIAIASVALLSIENYNFVFALLFLQVVYKILTPLTVKTLKNPIVISNLFIAAFHSITLGLMINNGLVNL